MEIVPFGDKELEEYLEKFDEQICDEFEVYMQLNRPDPGISLTDENGDELSEDVKKIMLEELEKSLGVEDTIINLIGLVVSDFGIFIYKGIDPLGNIEIIDVNRQSGIFHNGKIFNPVEDAKNKELR
jgi:hypothetical protein